MSATLAIKGRWSGGMHTEPRTFAKFTPPAKSRAKGDVWWGAYVSEDRFVGLIREIETAKGKQSAHEEVCAERYKAIENRFTSFEKKLDLVIAQAVTDQGTTSQWRMWALAGVFALMLAFMSWEAGQLYDLQPLRHADSPAKPAIP